MYMYMCMYVYVYIYIYIAYAMSKERGPRCWNRGGRSVYRGEGLDTGIEGGGVSIEGVYGSGATVLWRECMIAEPR